MSDLKHLPVSLATADEVLLRCCPERAPGRDIRQTAAAVIQRDKAELLELLQLLADGLEGDGTTQINVRTGLLATYVQPEFFPKFKRAVARHLDREVLRGVPLPCLRPQS